MTLILDTRQGAFSNHMTQP